MPAGTVRKRRTFRAAYVSLRRLVQDLTAAVAWTCYRIRDVLEWTWTFVHRVLNDLLGLLAVLVKDCLLPVLEWLQPWLAACLITLVLERVTFSEVKNLEGLVKAAAKISPNTVVLAAVAGLLAFLAKGLKKYLSAKVGSVAPSPPSEEEKKDTEEQSR